MVDITFDELLEVVETLNDAQKEILITKLTAPTSLTREKVLAEFERRKALGLFENAESLFGKFGNPNVDVSEEDLMNTLHDIATEWEQELDEFFGNEN